METYTFFTIIAAVISFGDHRPYAAMYTSDDFATFDRLSLIFLLCWSPVILVSHPVYSFVIVAFELA